MIPPSPVLSLQLELAREDLMEFLDYPPGHSPPRRMEPLMAQALATASRLVAARGAFVHAAPEKAGQLLLPPREASHLVLGLVTIGAALEQAVTSLTREGMMTAALMLDAAGSAAAERAADQLGAVIVGQERAPGPVACRLSPGYGDWPISAQPSLLASLPATSLGVSLTPGHMMLPRKSISFAMWLDSDGAGLPARRGCKYCSLLHCRYRERRTHEAVEHSESNTRQPPGNSASPGATP